MNPPDSLVKHHTISMLSQIFTEVAKCSCCQNARKTLPRHQISAKPICNIWTTISTQIRARCLTNQFTIQREYHVCHALHTPCNIPAQLLTHFIETKPVRDNSRNASHCCAPHPLLRLQYIVLLHPSPAPTTHIPTHPPLQCPPHLLLLLLGHLVLRRVLDDEGGELVAHVHVRDIAAGLALERDHLLNNATSK